jgi:hypothetical protein
MHAWSGRRPSTTVAEVGLAGLPATMFNRSAEQASSMAFHHMNTALLIMSGHAQDCFFQGGVDKLTALTYAATTTTDH